METILLPHLHRHPLRVGVFEGVTNAAFLRQQLLQGNASFEYAFLDAATVLSRRHLLAACFRAINDAIHGQMKSRNVHSEIVFALSPNNNIAESFRRFGISDNTTTIIAVKVLNPEADAHDRAGARSSDDVAAIDARLLSSIAGTCVALTDDRLEQVRDVSRLKKAYRIDVSTEGLPTTDAFLLGSMALRGS